MPRPFLLMLALVLAGAIRCGAAVMALDDPPAKEADTKVELKKLEGEWEIVSAETGGQIIESKSRMTLKADKCTLSAPGTGLPDLESTIAIDPAKNPRWMDVTNAKLKKTWIGIYELKGDSLRIVSQGDPKGPRPTQFKTETGGHEVMYTYRRVKK